MNRLEELMKAFSAMAETNAETAKLFAETSEIFANELRRFRAWEALLYLFFARYYFGKDDPVGLATKDREYLAGQRRELAQDEEGAKDIERIYEVLFKLIDAAQRHPEGPERDRAFLRLVPSPDKP